jgi:hypothetical protein
LNNTHKRLPERTYLKDEDDDDDGGDDDDDDDDDDVLLGFDAM